MSIQVVWENEEKTVLRFIYLRGWTWENFYEAGKEANEMMNSATNPVISIIDYSAGGIFPSGIPVHFRSIQRIMNSEKNSGINVIMAGAFGNAVAKNFIALFQRTMPSHLENSKWLPVLTLEEAKKLAQEKADELKSSKA